MNTTRLGRRLAGAALVSATLAIAVVAEAIPAAAAGTLTLSPNHGRSGDSFSASFTLGSQCPSGSKVDFSWDGSIALGSASVPAGNTGSCSVSGVVLVVPAGQDPTQQHLVKATAADQGGSRLGSKSAPFTVDPPASPSPTPVATPTSPPTRTPNPSPTPTASPTAVATPTATATPAPIATAAGTPIPRQTPLPLLDIASFPPHDCSNGIPETTACPTASADLALGGSDSPPVPPLTASTDGSHSGTSHTPLVLAGLVLLVGVFAVAAGWRAGTRTRRGLSRAGGAAPGRHRGPRRSGSR